MRDPARSTHVRASSDRQAFLVAGRERSRRKSGIFKFTAFCIKRSRSNLFKFTVIHVLHICIGAVDGGSRMVSSGPDRPVDREVQEAQRREEVGTREEREHPAEAAWPAGERALSLAQKMQVGPCIPVGNWEYSDILQL